MGEERDVPEPFELRQQISEMLFHTMSECNTSKGTKITSLTIKNLQNYSFDLDATATAAAFSFLQELHVRVCTEVMADDPIDYPEVQTFWPYFTETWLQPLSSQLKVLSIYCDSQ
jgi:hypothetical protein